MCGNLHTESSVGGAGDLGKIGKHACVDVLAWQYVLCELRLADLDYIANILA